MSTYAIKHFDLLDFVKRSKELGVSESLAEYQGRTIEEAIEVAVASSKEVVEAKNLVTQQDLKVEQSNLELKIKEVEANLEIKIKNLELKITEVESRLEIKIEQARNQVIIWMGSFLIASGVITHLLK